MVKGLYNCHAKGLHSIVLKEKSDGRPLIRAFVADRNHTLWQNLPFRTSTRHYPTHTMSVAFHRHRTNVMLINVKGAAANVILTKDESDRDIRFRFGPCRERLSAFTWDSKILGGTGGFRSEERTDLFFLEARELWYGPVAVKGPMYHTVYVPQNEEAAWLVLELDDNPEYTDTVYSDDDLRSWSSEGFYLPMSQDAIDQYVKKFNLPG